MRNARLVPVRNGCNMNRHRTFVRRMLPGLLLSWHAPFFAVKNAVGTPPPPPDSGGPQACATAVVLEVSPGSTTVAIRRWSVSCRNAALSGASGQRSTGA